MNHDAVEEVFGLSPGAGERGPSKILLVEDDRASRLVLNYRLESMGYEVVTAGDGVEAVELLNDPEIRIVISDWMMPGLDGLGLCRHIRTRMDRSYTYYMLLTAKAYREDRLEALRAGADDFLVKPVDLPELVARLNVARRILRMEQELRDRSRELERLHSELEVRNARLADMATRDGLTGLRNHRFFRENLESTVQLAQRQGWPLSVILLDVDHFKSYNDTFGHPAGDEALRTVAHLMSQTVRETDIACRYGGEEFSILLPGTDVAASIVLGERLRSAISGFAWPLRSVTASLGVATLSNQLSTSTTLIDYADRALYRSKAHGRNALTHAIEFEADETPRGLMVPEAETAVISSS